MALINKKKNIKQAEAEAAKGKTISPENYQDFAQYYEDPGPKPDTLIPILRWRQKIRRERRKLRKDLKSQGIKSRKEFEEIARELGLVLDDGKFALFLGWWKWFWAWLTSKAGLAMLAALAAAILLATFLWSYLTDLAGSFTINLTADMFKAGFVLYDNHEFENPQSRLRSERVKKVNNITLEDIPADIDSGIGQHNGDHYVAYTWYIRNEGDTTNDYVYTLTMKSSTQKVDKACWILLFEDGHQLLYAARADDGTVEGLAGYPEKPPFYEQSYDPNYEYFTDGSGEDATYGVLTTPMVDDHIVAQGLVKGVKPKDYHKYTCVIYVEGNDPDCTDELFGGFAKYEMNFDVLGNDERDLFSGIYRTEFDDYAAGKVTDDWNEELSKAQSKNP